MDNSEGSRLQWRKPTAGAETGGKTRIKSGPLRMHVNGSISWYIWVDKEFMYGWASEEVVSWDEVYSYEDAEDGWHNNREFSVFLQLSDEAAAVGLKPRLSFWKARSTAGKSTFKTALHAHREIVPEGNDPISVARTSLLCYFRNLPQSSHWFSFSSASAFKMGLIT